MVMRALFAVAIGLFAVSAAAQPPASKKPTTLTLSGCVQKSETSPNQFTLVDEYGIYRLIGVDVREFLGRRVQVVGGPPRKLKIVGGLKPSANVAGQAGTIDPGAAAIAVHDSATVNGTGPEIELRVKSIKSIGESCTQ
jgi:hypothetical protein